MLDKELACLNPIPVAPFIAALGVIRKVDDLSLESFEGGRYTVPHQVAEQPVWAREPRDCPGQPARHRSRATGSPGWAVPAWGRALHTALRGQGSVGTDEDRGLLGVGYGAGLWLAEADAVGASPGEDRQRPSNWPACTRPLTWTGPGGQAAVGGRFSENGVETILTHQQRPQKGQRPAPARITPWPRPPAAGSASAAR
jgi:hypothetical protein